VKKANAKEYVSPVQTSNISFEAIIQKASCRAMLHTPVCHDSLSRLFTKKTSEKYLRWHWILIMSSLIFSF